MMKFYAPHDSTERLLADGRPFEPGEYVTLSKEEMKDPHNKRLVDEGKLLAAGKDAS